MRGVLLGLTLSLLAVLGATPAIATILTYTFVPPDTPKTAMFYPSHPLSFSFDSTGPGFDLDYRSDSGYIDVTSQAIIPFTGASTNRLARVYYQGYGDPLTGIVSVLDLEPGGPGGGAYFDLYDKLITFKNKLPVFATGSFTVSDQAGQLVSLTITAGSPPAVPEPSSWMLQLIGFAVVGVKLRQRDRNRPGLVARQTRRKVADALV